MTYFSARDMLLSEIPKNISGSYTVALCITFFHHKKHVNCCLFCVKLTSFILLPYLFVHQECINLQLKIFPYLFVNCLFKNYIVEQNGLWAECHRCSSYALGKLESIERLTSVFLFLVYS